MSKKVIILVEDDLYKMEDMLLSIQSILFVAVKQRLLNAPRKNDTEICLLHVLDNGEQADPKTFGRFKSILEDRQRELMTPEYGCELKYKYETVQINKELYPPKNLDESECKKAICEKIEKISQKREYSIVLDVILVNKDDKDKNNVLNGERILSQTLYQKYLKHCIPYTKYDTPTKEFRTKWAEAIDAELPYERFCLDGNVIHKEFKQKLYGQLKIGIKGEEAGEKRNKRIQ